MSGDPADLIELLDSLGPYPHGIAREEVFAPTCAGDEPRTYYRCRCGGLYGRRAIRAHIQDPVGSWQRMPAAYRALVEGAS